jgi:hypothetical protein
MNIDEAFVEENGPRGWKLFVGLTDEVESGGPYCQRHRSWGQDFAQLQADAMAGVPLAVELMARFMAWRLKQ